MDVSAALVADPQPAELAQPSQGPFHHPAIHPQPAAVFHAPLDLCWRDVAPAQFLALLPGVIGPVGVQPPGSAPLPRTGGTASTRAGPVLDT